MARTEFIKKKKQELDPRRKKSVIMAWQAGVAPFEGGAINVWSLRLSKPRVDGVFYVMLSEVCHEPSMAQKGNPWFTELLWTLPLPSSTAV